MSNENNSENNEKVNPVVTFALFAYNQENYICEAIEGAFSQGYSPLEVILSDDCSTDATFELMSSMAANYKGSHKVILNCNKENLGITGHINKVMAMAKGELIVGAAGDDISLPHRVEHIVSTWTECNKQCHSIYSGVIEIDENGHQIGETSHPSMFLNKSLHEISAANPHITGATHAWSKDVFSIFGDLMQSVSHEDCTIPFRSKLLGDVLMIKDPLVKYRVNMGISSSYADTSQVEDELLIIGRYINDYRQKLKDALLFGRLDLVPILEKQIRKFEFAILVGRKKLGFISAVSYCLKHSIGCLYGIKQLFKYKIPGVYFILNCMR